MRALPASLPTRRAMCKAAGLLIAGAAAASGMAWAKGEAADIEFNSQFLRNTGSAPIDLSRFQRGNVASPGTYRAELYVNQAWIGRIDVQLQPVGADRQDVQPCFDRSLLDRIGVDSAHLKAEARARLDPGPGTCVPLPALVAAATASFDLGEQRLDVSVPQAAMLRQPRGYVDPQYWDEGVDAALLQYNANVFHSESRGETATSGFLGLAAGLNWGPWRLRHRGNLTHEPHAGSRYQNVQASLQRSVIPLKSQLTLGDAFTDGFLFDSAGIRGIQLASDDRMLPESRRGYAPVVRGIARSNARVQIRQNGNLLHETTVAPGPFVIDDLYPTGYGGDLEVTLSEADGSVHVSRVPYAAAVNALRAGSTRYSLAAGQYRDATIAASPLLLQGTVQHGFSNLLTGYGGLLASEGYAAAGAGLALNTDYGAFGLDFIHAKTRLREQPDQDGESLRLSYSKLLEPTSTNITLAAYRYSTRGYLGLADAIRLREPEAGQSVFLRGIERGKLQATLDQSLAPGWGSFYLSGSVKDYWNRSGRDVQFQAGYSNSYKRVHYGLALSRQLDLTQRRAENRVTFTASLPLGDGFQAPSLTSIVQRDSLGGSSFQTTVNGTLGADNAVAYGVNMGRSDTGVATSNIVGGSVSYASPVAALGASFSRSSNSTQLSAGISGGLVAYSGGIALTPSLGDTVAVVEAKDAAGARVANGAGLRVDPWGHAVVSSLTPFARNEITIDPKGLPLNIELKSTMQLATPTAGAVVKVKFETENTGRTAIIEGRRVDGEPLPFGAEVRDANGLPVGTVAQGGRILARGLKEDSGVLTVVLDAGNHQQCRLSYHLSTHQGGRADALTKGSGICSDSTAAADDAPGPRLVLVKDIHPR
ncbi:MAG TPA: fimbria/pilus outer membrane usher protein [Ramlibacter sp.]|uniref:fimbria/pilus outer membrane usher protein n=1 Tax=Ramlibacter sp. TaxID=1917967 RepID=UPI002D7F95D9|nr:fimbria/pilus outer membrane usher protein [Ramlibacter sp.]HET8747751.1 fimbria/pilus outer membrane usher protein [Ramlibacter sp.]